MEKKHHVDEGQASWKFRDTIVAGLNSHYFPCPAALGMGETLARELGPVGGGIG
jgi:hypothetical protein